MANNQDGAEIISLPKPTTSPSKSSNAIGSQKTSSDLCDSSSFEAHEKSFDRTNGIPRAANLTLDNSPVHLNVGGRVYTTSLETLTSHPNSRISKLFNGEIPVVLDTINHQYFIDRDGNYFRFVLNYLRTGKSNISEKFEELSGLLEEAKYFGLNGMVRELNELIESRRKLTSAKREISDDVEDQPSDVKSQQRAAESDEMASKKFKSNLIVKPKEATESEAASSTANKSKKSIQIVLINYDTETKKIYISGESQLIKSIFSLDSLSTKSNQKTQASTSNIDKQPYFSTSERSNSQEEKTTTIKSPHQHSPSSSSSSPSASASASTSEVAPPTTTTSDNNEVYMNRVGLSDPQMHIVELIERMYTKGFVLEATSKSQSSSSIKQLQQQQDHQESPKTDNNSSSTTTSTSQHKLVDSTGEHEYVFIRKNSIN